MFEDSTHGGRQRNRAGLWGRIISTHALTEGDGGDAVARKKWQQKVKKEREEK